MFNRTYHTRTRRKLKGEQLDFSFPRRGRPSRFRVLEKSGQLQINFSARTGHAFPGAPPSGGGGRTEASAVSSDTDTFDDALQMTFPARPYTEDELYREFCRLFPADDDVRL